MGDYPTFARRMKAADPPRCATDTRLLGDWLRSGAQRLDRDQDGRYDHDAAVALMDAWWDRLIHAMFDPQLDGLYGVVGVNFHDAPTSHLGSASQGSYYGTVKTIRGF
jgi:hypothetical protein